MAILRTSFQRIDGLSLVLVIGTAAVFASLSNLIGHGISRPVLFTLFAAATVVAYRIALDRDRKRFVAIGVLLGCALVGVDMLGQIVLVNYHAPATWDFFAFYMDGSVGARGLNFYQPDSYRQVFPELVVPITIRSDFVPEIVEVGFMYPPITMFLLFWMGFLPLGQAHVLWLASVCTAFGFATWALARHLLVDGSLPIRLLAATALITMLPASINTLQLEQTCALLLAVSVLCLAANTDKRAGLLAALAFTIKPILVLAAGYHFLRARWVALGYFLGALVALIAAAMIVFGPVTVLDYVRANPVPNAPPWMFTEWHNQSLLATLVRLNPSVVPSHQAIWYPQFLLIGAVVAAISTWLAWRLAQSGDKLAFGLLIGAALMLYPGTQKPYGMLMLIPLVQLGMRTWHTLPGAACFAAFTAFVYFVDDRMLFAANAAVWSATCVWAVCGEKLEPYFRASQTSRSAM